VSNTKIGTVAVTAPVRGRPYFYDWDGCAKLLEANPGLWVLLLNDVNTGLYSYSKKNLPPALAALGGELKMRLLNQKTIGRSRKGELWGHWTPTGWTEDDQARAEASVEAGEAVI
jgi:hypothetical protein